MVFVIAKKEFLELVRDGRFRLLAVIVLCLLAAAAAAGWQQQQTASLAQAEANEIMRREWLDQGDKNPHMAGHYGTFIFKPVQTLSLFDRGIESYTGTQVFLEAHKQNDFNFRPARDKTVASRFAELTAATILQLIVPLLIFLLTFAALTSEREDGTLRQILSLGLSRKQFAAGKIAGIFSAILTILIPVVLLGSAALLVTGKTSNNDNLGGRFALLAIGYLLYFSICIFVGLWVSAWANSTKTALLVLLVLWFVCALIVPRSATALAKAVYPTSTLEFQENMARDFEQGIDGHNGENKRNEEFKAKVLAEYGVKDTKDLPVNFDGMLMQADEDYRAIVMDRRFGELWQSWKKQGDLQAVSGVLLPVQAVRNFSMSMAETDLSAQQNFADSTERYRRKMVKILNDDMTVNSKTGDWDYESGRKLYEQIPDFQYQPLSVAESLRNQIVSVFVLSLWFALSLGAMSFAVLKMKIE